MLIASDYVTLSVGAAVALGSIGVGALIENVRERASWRRQERTRWSNDLRVVYRDLIGKGDEIADRLQSIVSATGYFLTIDANDLLADLRSRWIREAKELIGALGASVAEIDLIASDAERDVVHKFQKSVNDFLFAIASEEIDQAPSPLDAEAAYRLQRAELVREARRSLRQDDQT
jgi:hypothetical protein